jgi:UMF1 family MFS transporter
MLVALSPPEKLGEFFGLFSLAGRFSAILGPALTATLLLAFGRGGAAYRISIGSLAVIMALGIFFLLRVPDARPDPTVEEYATEARVK